MSDDSNSIEDLVVFVVEHLYSDGRISTDMFSNCSENWCDVIEEAMVKYLAISGLLLVKGTDAT
jgi:hypothetical protein